MIKEWSYAVSFIYLDRAPRRSMEHSRRHMHGLDRNRKQTSFIPPSTYLPNKYDLTENPLLSFTQSFTKAALIDNMVLPFVPTYDGNDTGVLICDGIQSFNTLRVNFTTTTSTYEKLSLSFFIITTVVFLASVPMAWYIRRESRFNKLRPFSLTCLLLFFLIFFNSSAFLSYAGKLKM